MTMLKFRIHPNRSLIGAPGNPPFIRVHLDGWDAAYEFRTVRINVPSDFVGGADMQCGCVAHVANCWVEGEVEESEVTYSDDGKDLFLGTYQGPVYAGASGASARVGD